MSERVLKIGLIGCGKIGATHADAISSIAGAELVAVCDRTAAKARTIAESHGAVSVFSSVDQLLETSDLDAVTIATDHKHHFDPAIAAINRGVHVLVEKPITTTLHEARTLVDAANSAGVTLGAVFQRRFFPAAQRMHAAIETGRLGRLITAECIAHLGRDRSYFEKDDWRGTWSGEGGGVLMNQAIHMVDMLLWMMGTPTEVYGRWATLKHADYINVEDTACAVISFENGAFATLQAVTTFENGLASSPSEFTSYRAPGFRLAVHGSLGHTVGLLESPELMQAITDRWTFDGEGENVAAWSDMESNRTGFPEFHADQIADFVRAIATGTQPTVTGADALRALEVVKAVYLSEARRRPVTLPMTDADRREADALHSEATAR